MEVPVYFDAVEFTTFFISPRRNKKYRQTIDKKIPGSKTSDPGEVVSRE